MNKGGDIIVFEEYLNMIIAYYHNIGINMFNLDHRRC